MDLLGYIFLGFSLYLTSSVSGEVAGTCYNTRDNGEGNARCSDQLAGGETCINYLSWKDCDRECSLCPCSTASETSSEHCSGHGTCEASCTTSSCSGAKCKCDPGWTGNKCESLAECPEKCVEKYCAIANCDAENAAQLCPNKCAPTTKPVPVTSTTPVPVTSTTPAPVTSTTPDLESTTTLAPAPTTTPTVVYKFDETCCTNNGVPEQCMGLCREKTDRDVNAIYPIDQCEEHRNTIRDCMIAVPVYVTGVTGSDDCPAKSQSITSRADCEAAAASLDFQFSSQNTWPVNPKGCFLKISTSKVYFNTHKTGNRRDGYGTICIQTVFSKGDFWMAEKNTNCPAGQIVATISECKVASAALRRKYKGEYESDDRPAGCYGYPDDNDAYFNAIISGESSENTAGICKTGNWIDCATISTSDTNSNYLKLLNCPQNAGYIWKLEDSTGVCAQTSSGWFDWEWPNDDAQKPLGYYFDTFAQPGFIGPATPGYDTSNCRIMSRAPWKDTASVYAYKSTGSITVYYLSG